jgi:hypothetical protein
VGGMTTIRKDQDHSSSHHHHHRRRQLPPRKNKTRVSALEAWGPTLTIGDRTGTEVRASINDDVGNVKRYSNMGHVAMSWGIISLQPFLSCPQVMIHGLGRVSESSY